MRTHAIRDLLFAASLAAMPAFGSAAEHSVAMNNCVSAFTQALAQGAAPVKVRESRFIAGDAAPGISLSSHSEMLLTATDARDYHRIARAICRLDANGQVTGLEKVAPQGLLPP